MICYYDTPTFKTMGVSKVFQLNIIVTDSIVRICNKHWQRPPFFRLEGSPSAKRVSRPALVFP